ncbi:hemerythrin domain-containing protein [Sphaerisporangium perillae]|uniref:hemerythrin domain-containing protein n=1 Tax=Sphaerisporangium perillae TaxID=2935860 RepID=UPI00200EB246|nr:hemerythrin domain-containing protein [Sphaerisporangium perillae]
MPTTSTTTPPDLTAFLVAHKAMKAEYGRLADVAAAVDPADGDRVAAVEAHIAFMIKYLHHHHAPEDNDIWPALRLADPSAVAVLNRLEADHADIDVLLEQIGDRGRTPAQRAPILRELQARLADHLTLEEREAVPLIRRHLTQELLEEVHEKIMKSWDKPDLPFLFGIAVTYANKAETDHLLTTVPWFVRLLWRLVMRPTFNRRMRQVYGA